MLNSFIVGRMANQLQPYMWPSSLLYRSWQFKKHLSPKVTRSVCQIEGSEFHIKMLARPLGLTLCPWLWRPSEDGAKKQWKPSNQLAVYKGIKAGIVYLWNNVFHTYFNSLSFHYGSRLLARRLCFALQWPRLLIWCSIYIGDNNNNSFILCFNVLSTWTRTNYWGKWHTRWYWVLQIFSSRIRNVDNGMHSTIIISNLAVYFSTILVVFSKMLVTAEAIHLIHTSDSFDRIPNVIAQ